MGSSRRSVFCHPFRILSIFILAVGLAACGSDGSDGEQGPPGPPGPEGPAGEDAVDLTGVTPIQTQIDVSNSVEYDAGSGTLTVHFTLQDEDGNGIDVTQEDGWTMRLLVSELLEDAAGPGGADWDRLLYERGTPLPGTLTLTDAVTGSYTYVFDGTVDQSDNLHRVTVRARWRETINGERVYFGAPANGSFDFRPNSAVPPQVVAEGAKPVSNEACASCHGAFYLADPSIGHGGGYTEATTCVHCHNPNYLGDPDAEADFPFMIHRIHNAGEFDELDHGDPLSFAELTYPQQIYNCAKCHSGPDADVDLEATPGAVLSAYERPTAANCGSCHSQVNFATGENHGPNDDGSVGPQPDTACTTCHGVDAGLGGGIRPIHMPDPVPENVSEYDVEIAMTAPSNGTHYTSADNGNVVVTVTLTNPDSGLEEDPNGTALDYTTEGPQENTSDGLLHVAQLAIYGPRSGSLPVLATNTISDPAYVPGTTPTQRHDLFGADPQIESTPAGGFQYRLLGNFEDLEDGTYMVRAEVEDYGTPGSPSVPEYWTASVGIINFQVGTDVEQAKRSGDACTDCHGDTIMHLEGAHPHHAEFNTDECLACHDTSGNYGEYIGNRVHAVHNSTVTGDLHASLGSRDWTEVTYPMAPNNCFKCHTDSETELPVWRDPNEIACGGCHGADPDANPTIYPDAEQEQVSAEAAAANHMVSQGGTFDPATTNPTDPDYVVRSCIVCHGEDGIADPEVTHNLRAFPQPVVPDDT
jgi:OmcA/MtrC family decaheme c-type cytochrome